MAPSPLTPSPHRFITPKPVNPTPKPSSSLRFQHPQAQLPPTSSQFVATPKFGFGPSSKPARSTPATQYSSPLSRRPHLPTPISTKNREDIEEASSDYEDPSKDDLHLPRFDSPSSEHTTKRRRPNPPHEAITISSSPSPSPPSTPPLPTVGPDSPFPDSKPHQPDPLSHHPRFVLPTPHHSTTPNIPQRPPVILPPRSPSPPSSPPLFFSPHRRGQKYVSGGLAATVRDWVVETSQIGYRHGRGKSQEEEVWDMQSRVGEMSGSEGMLLVRTNDGGRWILAGKGRGGGNVSVGCVVGIRQPTWEVQVQEHVWRVGVEWKVLET